MVSEYSKRTDDGLGYTMEEAKIKKAKVDEALEVGSPTSKWKPADIVPDETKKSGYKVIATTI